MQGVGKFTHKNEFCTRLLVVLCQSYVGSSSDPKNGGPLQVTQGSPPVGDECMSVCTQSVWCDVRCCFHLRYFAGALDLLNPAGGRSRVFLSEASSLFWDLMNFNREGRDEGVTSFFWGRGVDRKGGEGLISVMLGKTGGLHKTITWRGVARMGGGGRGQRGKFYPRERNRFRILCSVVVCLRQGSSTLRGDQLALSHLIFPCRIVPSENSTRCLFLFNVVSDLSCY